MSKQNKSRALRLERDALQKERDILQKERDALHQELDFAKEIAHALTTNNCDLRRCKQNLRRQKHELEHDLRLANMAKHAYLAISALFFVLFLLKGVVL